MTIRVQTQVFPLLSGGPGPWNQPIQLPTQRQCPHYTTMLQAGASALSGPFQGIFPEKEWALCWDQHARTLHVWSCQSDINSHLWACLQLPIDSGRVRKFYCWQWELCSSGLRDSPCEMDRRLLPTESPERLLSIWVTKTEEQSGWLHLLKHCQALGDRAIEVQRMAINFKRNFPPTHESCALRSGLFSLFPLFPGLRLLWLYQMESEERAICVLARQAAPGAFHVFCFVFLYGIEALLFFTAVPWDKKKTTDEKVEGLKVDLTFHLGWDEVWRRDFPVCCFWPK